MGTPPPAISWLMGVTELLPPEEPADILSCLLMANRSLAPHEVDLPRGGKDSKLLFDELLPFISTTAELIGELPWLICRLRIMALRAAAASDWLRGRNNDLKPLFDFSGLCSPFAGEALSVFELSLFESPDLLRDRLKLNNPFKPVDPLLGR